MKTIVVNEQNLNRIQKMAPHCVMALGYFDGVHLGHQQVIKTAREEATKRGLPLALMSFRPHPINVLSKGRRSVPQLTTLSEKQNCLKQLGVDYFYLVEFTMEFAALSPREFVEDYLCQLRVAHAVAGFDFTYGAKGVAKVEQITEDSSGKIPITKVPCIHFRGEKISSSAIRERLESASIHEIPNFLGKHYSVLVQGDGHGGFQQIEKTALPSPGIYVAELEFGSHRMKALLSIDSFDQITLVRPQMQLPKNVYTISWLQLAEISAPSVHIS